MHWYNDDWNYNDSTLRTVYILLFYYKRLKKCLILTFREQSTTSSALRYEACKVKTTSNLYVFLKYLWINRFERNIILNQYRFINRDNTTNFRNKSKWESLNKAAPTPVIKLGVNMKLVLKFIYKINWIGPVPVTTSLDWVLLTPRCSLFLYPT